MLVLDFVVVELAFGVALVGFEGAAVTVVEAIATLVVVDSVSSVEEEVVDVDKGGIALKL